MSSKFLDSDVERRIQLFLRPHADLIRSWTAELQASCVRPREPLNLPDSDEDGKHTNWGELDFLIKISRKCSPSTLRNLIILHWFLPEDTRKFITIAAEEVSKQRRFRDQIDLMIFMKSKSHCLLLLQQQRITYDAFFGGLGNVIRLIREEVDALRKKNKCEKLISLPLWKLTTFDKPNGYSGYSRHHKDAGSLPPTGNQINKEIARDKWIEEQYLKKREELEKLIWSTTEIVLGGIL